MPRRRAATRAAASVALVPSRSAETFGLAAAEAMAAGLPVVASDIPGYAAVLPPTCGRLVPPGDAGALAGALRELLDDEALRARLGGAGRKEARRYDWSAVVDDVLAVYERILRR